MKSDLFNIQSSQDNSKLTVTYFYFEFTEFIDFMHNKAHGGKLINGLRKISIFPLFFTVCDNGFEFMSNSLYPMR